MIKRLLFVLLSIQFASSSLADDEALLKATKGISKQMAKLSKAIAGEEKACKALEVMECFEALTSVLEFVIPFLGFITAFLGLFGPSDTQQILDALQQVSEQVEDVKDTMVMDFEKTFDAIHEETCFNAMLESQERLILGYDKWIKAADYKNKGNDNMSQIYLDDFMDTCQNAACDLATTVILDGLNGGSGTFRCDIMDIVYNGYVYDGHYIGWRDDVAEKVGFLINLVNMGVAMQSAYISEKTQNPDAYKQVQDRYQKPVNAAYKRAQKYDKMCVDNFQENMQTNAYNTVTSASGAKNADVAKLVLDVLNSVDPYKYWFVAVWKPDDKNKNSFEGTAAKGTYWKDSYNNQYSWYIFSLAMNSTVDQSRLNWDKVVEAERGYYPYDIFTPTDFVDDVAKQTCVSGILFIDPNKKWDVQIKTNFGNKYESNGYDGLWDTTFIWAAKGDNGLCKASKLLNLELAITQFLADRQDHAALPHLLDSQAPNDIAVTQYLEELATSNFLAANSIPVAHNLELAITQFLSAHGIPVTMLLDNEQLTEEVMDLAFSKYLRSNDIAVSQFLSANDIAVTQYLLQ